MTASDSVAGQCINSRARTVLRSGGSIMSGIKILKVFIIAAITSVAMIVGSTTAWAVPGDALTDTSADRCHAASGHVDWYDKMYWNPHVRKFVGGKCFGGPLDGAEVLDVPPVVIG